MTASELRGTGPLSWSAAAVAFGLHLLAGELYPQEPSLPLLHLSDVVSIAGDHRDLRGVRALTDGTLLLADRGSGVKVVRSGQLGAAPLTGTPSPIPASFRPWALFALPADTTAVWDAWEGEIYLVDPSLNAHLYDLKIAGVGESMDVIGIDSVGGALLGTLKSGPRFPAPGGGFSIERSQVLLRSDRWIGMADSVATLSLGGRTFEPREFGMTDIRRSPGTTPELVEHFPDGRIALLRRRPDRVQWVHPDGTVAVGDSLAEQLERRGDGLSSVSGEWHAIQQGPNGRVVLRLEPGTDADVVPYVLVGLDGRLEAWFRLSRDAFFLGTDNSDRVFIVNQTTDGQILLRARLSR